MPLLDHGLCRVPVGKDFKGQQAKGVLLLNTRLIGVNSIVSSQSLLWNKTRWPMWRMLCALSLAGILCALPPVSAQQAPVDKEEWKKLQAELEKARSQVRDLEARLKKVG